MPRHHDLMHQQARLIEYRDQIRGCLFKSYQIMVQFFPDANIRPLNTMMSILDTDVKSLIEEDISTIITNDRN